MVGDAGDRVLGPGNALYALDDTDLHLLLVEDGALLDVQLDEGMRLQLAGLRGAEIADAAKLVADRDAVLVGRGIGLVETDASHIDEAAHHVGLEACAFLVGEEGDGDRPPRRHVGGVQRAHDLEAGQHAIVAVIAAAGANRVDMAAGHDGRDVLATGAQADHVPDRVDPDVEAQLLHPVHDEVAAGLVFVGQRQAGAAAAVDGPDGGKVVERAEQAPIIQTQHDFPSRAKTLAHRQVITAH
jgi:hypothetical protein